MSHRRHARHGLEIGAIVLVVAIPICMFLFGRYGAFLPVVPLTFMLLAAESEGWRKSTTDRIRRNRVRRSVTPLRPPPPPFAPAPSERERPFRRRYPGCRRLKQRRFADKSAVEDLFTILIGVALTLTAIGGFFLYWRG